MAALDMASSIREFRLPLFLWRVDDGDVAPVVGKEDWMEDGPVRVGRWLGGCRRGLAGGEGNEPIDGAVELTVVLLKWDCLRAGVSSMMVSTVDWCRGLLMWVLVIR